MNPNEEGGVCSNMLFLLQECKKSFLFIQLHDVAAVSLFIDGKMTERSGGFTLFPQNDEIRSKSECSFITGTAWSFHKTLQEAREAFK